MSACPLGLCNGNGVTIEHANTFAAAAITFAPCPCAAPASATPLDPWALLALRRAEHDGAERIYEAARVERSRTWQARYDARIVADASGIPRPT